MRLDLCPTVLLAFGVLGPLAYGDETTLILVEDLGGTSAHAYYEQLQLKPRPSPGATLRPTQIAAPSARRFSEADLLPVRSMLLTPGVVERRTMDAPALRPFFLIGDDARSHAWLRERIDVLRTLNAVGLVVNVESTAALDELRRLATGVTLSPASGDDIARRLGLAHYPVLITATGIEQ